jgi:hypothetical protein
MPGTGVSASIRVPPVEQDRSHHERDQRAGTEHQGVLGSGEGHEERLRRLETGAVGQQAVARGEREKTSDFVVEEEPEEVLDDEAPTSSPPIAAVLLRTTMQTPSPSARRGITTPVTR